ncbi:hypothetical protein OROGR_033310 [Orobanche gracilis]
MGWTFSNDDLRTNPFQEEGNDVDQYSSIQTIQTDPIQMAIGPMTRGRIKQFKAALNRLAAHHVKNGSESNERIKLFDFSHTST